MAGEENNATPPAGDVNLQVTTPVAPPANSGVKTFSQDELNRLVGREREEARRATERQLSEQLGVSVEDAKKLIEAQRESDKAKMSEVDRKLADATEREQKATQRETEANRKLHEARLTSALIVEGVPRDNLEDVRLLVRVSDDADDEAVASAVAAVKDKYPTLFGGQQVVQVSALSGNSTTARAPSSAPKGPNPVPKGTDDAFARGFNRGKADATPASAAPAGAIQ